VTVLLYRVDAAQQGGQPPVALLHTCNPLVEVHPQTVFREGMFLSGAGQALAEGGLTVIIFAVKPSIIGWFLSHSGSPDITTAGGW